MLPTLGFVLGAYGTYAFFRAWSRRHRSQFRSSSRWRRKSRLTLVGGTGVGVGIVILISILGLPGQYENLRSASLLSSSWGHDPWGADQAVQRQEILPLKNLGDHVQPVYAYLHPESPSSQLLPEQNAPGPRPLQKPKLRKPVPPVKAQKPVAKATSKKEKAPSKTRAKKKKANAQTGNLPANSG